MKSLKYPIGVQDFEKLRSEGYVYVDKTHLIYQLIKTGKYYFLSRPRRFGKSLLLTTMDAFFEGKRGLFSGLFIDSCEDVEWDSHPVIHIDLNAKDYSHPSSLTQRLENQLSKYEEIYGRKGDEDSLDGRFLNLIEAAYKATGKGVVILVDEYDKPILDTLHLPELSEANKSLLSGFYSVIKSSDAYIDFCFLTGITKFNHVNIFSGLNNLRDISFSDEYEAICGITESELKDNFMEGLEKFAEKINGTVENVCQQLKSNYDGYHFSQQMKDIYNPFSVLRSLCDEKFGYYWFYSGTPTFLINMLKAGNVELSDLDGIEVLAPEFEGLLSLSNPASLMYQTGYLTITSYDSESDCYTLGYPNHEVRAGFFSALLPAYVGTSESESNFEIRKFVKDLNNGDPAGFLERMNTFFYDFPYEHAPKVERHFQNVMYIVAKLMGMNVKVEYHTSRGRIDMLVLTKDYIYIFEFKRDQSPKEALTQIEEKGYSKPFEKDGRKIIRVGVEFSTAERCIARWEIVEW